MVLLTLLATTQLLTVDDDGPADFATIQAAIDAVDDGGTVLVRAGDYGLTRITGKSVNVFVDGDANTNCGVLEVTDLAAGQRVLVHGWVTTGGMRLRDSEGGIWLEDCRVDSFGALTATFCDSVVMVGCTMNSDPDWYAFGPSEGVEVFDSTLHAYGSTFIGGQGLGGSSLIECVAGSPGGPAVELSTGSWFFASDCSFAGGDGGNAGTEGFEARGNGSDGGPGLLSYAGTNADLLGCTLAGGPAGLGTDGCLDGAQGSAVQELGGVVDFVDEAPRSISTPGPVQPGETFDVVVSGESGDQVFAVAAASTFPLELPGVAGPLQPASPWVIVPVGPLPASGVATLSVTLGASAAGAGATVLALQTLHVTPSLAAYLGAPATLAIIDTQL